MPEYFFKPTIKNPVMSLKRIASDYELKKIYDLSTDQICLWQGDIKPDFVPVRVTYNPKNEFPLSIGTPGPYFASEIPNLKKFLEKYQQAIKSEKIMTDEPPSEELQEIMGIIMGSITED